MENSQSQASLLPGWFDGWRKDEEERRLLVSPATQCDGRRRLEQQAGGCGGAQEQEGLWNRARHAETQLTCI